MGVLALSLALATGEARAHQPLLQDQTGKFVQAWDHADQVQRDLASAYLNGIIEGTQWTETHFQADGVKQHICFPDGAFSLTSEQMMTEMKVKLQAVPSLATKPVGLVLIFALQDMYPCSQEANP
jgi:hypothetical protein